MKSIYTELALYGSNNECARTENVFSPISEVCDGTVSLTESTLKSPFLNEGDKQGDNILGPGLTKMLVTPGHVSPQSLRY